MAHDSDSENGSETQVQTLIHSLQHALEKNADAETIQTVLNVLGDATDKQQRLSSKKRHEQQSSLIKTLRQHRLRAKAYSKVFYTDRSWWKRTYYGISGTTLLLGATASILGLVLEPEVGVLVASIGNLVLKLVDGFNIILDPSDAAGSAEAAGDQYKNISTRLGRIDTTRDLDELIELERQTITDLEQITNSTEDPSQRRIDEEIAKLKERYKQRDEFFGIQDGIEIVVDADEHRRRPILHQSSTYRDIRSLV